MKTGNYDNAVLIVCVYVSEHGVEEGRVGGFMPLPTRPQRYRGPTSLVPVRSALAFKLLSDEMGLKFQVWNLRLRCFLVACTRLYNPLCPSVCRSVSPLVRRSVGSSVRWFVGPSVHWSVCHT